MIDNGILILDDVLPKTYVQQIEQTILEGITPWYLLKDITSGDASTERNYGFTHFLGGSRTSDASPLLSFLTPVAYASADAAGIKFDSILHARMFMQIPRNTNVTHNKAHIDTPENHMVVLYYVNDSDGDTFIFDETRDSITEDNRHLITSKTHTHKAITPKAGRIVVFNGHRYHASSCPQQHVRCVINYNLTLAS
jgi:hypothetical protein